MVERGMPEEGGPVGIMLHEHRLGREYITVMRSTFEEWKEESLSAADRIISAKLCATAPEPY